MFHFNSFEQAMITFLPMLWNSSTALYLFFKYKNTLSLIWRQHRDLLISQLKNLHNECRLKFLKYKYLKLIKAIRNAFQHCAALR